jgi:hypothetical protein
MHVIKEISSEGVRIVLDVDHFVEIALMSRELCRRELRGEKYTIVIPREFIDGGVPFQEGKSLIFPPSSRGDGCDDHTFLLHTTSDGEYGNFVTTFTEKGDHV